MPGNDSTTSGAIIESRLKAMHVIDLVINSEHRTLSDAIARQAGYADRRGAWKAVKQLLARNESDAAASYRASQNAGLDVAIPLAFARMLEAMFEGDDVRVSTATKTWVLLLERQARANGSDAPIKVDAKISDEYDAQIRELIEQLGTGPVPQEP
jgi:hypothetical protein